VVARACKFHKTKTRRARDHDGIFGLNNRDDACEDAGGARLGLDAGEALVIFVVVLELAGTAVTADVRFTGV
jgi:hypothetical protein